MKWKDDGSEQEKNLEQSDVYYEGDGYSSYPQDAGKGSAVPVRYFYWAVGIAIVAGLMLLFSNIFGDSDQARIDALEQKVVELEARLQKVDGVDEKVTRIWEQAKTFETFKSRFDRAEASISLRMDRLTTSLDDMQKKSDAAFKKIEQIEKRPAPAAVAPTKTPVVKKAAAAKTHTVAAGDTLFSIGQRYQLSVDQLRALNKLPPNAVLQVGQTLTVGPPKPAD
jgi:LysM repeat protein